VRLRVYNDRMIEKVAKEVDQMLVTLSNRFDLLWITTPMNVESAWKEFQKMSFAEAPHFVYRPLIFDPFSLKRYLRQIPTDKVKDPALSYLFHEKVVELEHEITMLMGLGSENFLRASVELYGSIESDLLRLAKKILKLLPPAGRETKGRMLKAKAFAFKAQQEIAYYKKLYPGFTAAARVRDDFSGIMVSRHNFYIGSDVVISPDRVEAVLQHEIGTHLLTHFNGRRQPLKQLCTGLAGYDELQEGLAVLTEYLSGGFNRPRLRLLAGRVVAAQCLMDGLSFLDTYHHLKDEYRFREYTAYVMTMRVHRAGGCTKDAVYLRGLKIILNYFQKGGEMETLLIGKIAFSQVPIIKDLLNRQILQPPLIKPRYLKKRDAQKRLERIRTNVTVQDLI
jgi:uncharacterized protein (TIGR02421 family)